MDDRQFGFFGAARRLSVIRWRKLFSNSFPT
jgi:hypothetical protein